MISHRRETFLVLLLVACMLACAAPSGDLWPFRSAPDLPDTSVGAAAAALLSHAIRIDTVNPPGNEAELAGFLVGVLRDHGIEARLIETPANGSGPRRGAAWGVVPGTGTRRPVVLLSHLDVVPAERDQWLVDPFEGVVAGGYVVGRGALDAKGVSVVHLLTLLELARRDKKLERDVVFLATPDEEMGGRLGAGFVASRRPELLRNAEYLLTEGGGILDGRGGEPNVWGVTLSEKSPCWIRLTARGAAGHSSAGTPDAAVPRLIRALDRVRRLETEVRVAPDVARMFETLSHIAPAEDRFGLRNLAYALGEDAEFRGRFLAVPAHAALVRNTMSITVLQAGSHTNVVPSRAVAQVDARLLPGESCEAFTHRLRQEIADPAIELETLLSFATRSSPAGTRLFDAIRSVAAELDPGALVVPRVISGFTDAHYFRDLGMVAYGFVPRWLSPHESMGIHGPNERISVDNLERGVRTLVRILETLDAGESEGDWASGPRG